ncbi:hypothetical protein D3C71_1745240 [compost metagenome]
MLPPVSVDKDRGATGVAKFERFALLGDGHMPAAQQQVVVVKVDLDSLTGQVSFPREA